MYFKCTFTWLLRSDMVLRSDLHFSFVTGTPLRALFALDAETKYSEKILSFSTLLNLINGTIKIQFVSLRNFEIFLPSFHEKILDVSFFWTFVRVLDIKNIGNICQYYTCLYGFIYKRVV